MNPGPCTSRRAIPSAAHRLLLSLRSMGESFTPRGESAMGTKRAERLIATMPWLDQTADLLQKVFAPFVGEDAPRELKDTLVGTWLGHPLHPAVVALPIGAWTSALALDFAGEERAADLLIGLG